MAEIHANRVDERKLDTVLAEDIVFEGDVSFEKDFMIKGHFSGNIKANGDLYIGENAEVHAEVEASAVYIRGHVFGNVKAARRVELLGSAVVEGDITSPKLVMDTGCRFDGTSRMGVPGGESADEK